MAEVLNAGFDFGPDESSAGIVWHYDADDHEGFVDMNTWFYEWVETADGIEFRFLGDADTLIR